MSQLFASAPPGSSSPLTTKGDIYVYGSGDTRLPIGTNGFVLTADSTQTTGMKWAAATGTISGSGTINTFTYWDTTSSLASTGWGYVVATDVTSVTQSTNDTNHRINFGTVGIYASMDGADRLRVKMGTSGNAGRFVAERGDGTFAFQSVIAGGGIGGSLTNYAANDSFFIQMFATDGTNQGLLCTQNMVFRPGAAVAVTFTSAGLVNIVGLTASQAVFTDSSKNLVSNAITGTGNVVMSASPTLTGTITAAAATFSGNVTVSTLTASLPVVSDASKVLTSMTYATFAGNLTHNNLAGLTTGDPHTQYALLAGRSGGQTLNGDTASGGNLTLESTANATKGKILLGASSAFDEVNNRLGLGITSPVSKIHLDAGVGVGSVIRMTVGATTGQTNTDGFIIGVDLNAVGQIRNYENQNVDFYTNNLLRGSWTAAGLWQVASLTASQAVFTDGSKNLVSNAITGTGNVVMSASPTLTGTITAAAETLSGNLTLSALTASLPVVTDASKVLVSMSYATFAGNLAHNSLSGLTTGDPHTQYALLAGRSGGQILNGGTASANNLTLVSTAHATKGNIYLGVASTTNGIWISPNNDLNIGDEFFAGAVDVTITRARDLAGDVGIALAVLPQVSDSVGGGTYYGMAMQPNITGSLNPNQAVGALFGITWDANGSGGELLGLSLNADYQGSGDIDNIYGVFVSTGAGGGGTVNTEIISLNVTEPVTTASSKVMGIQLAGTWGVAEVEDNTTTGVNNAYPIVSSNTIFTAGSVTLNGLANGKSGKRALIVFTSGATINHNSVLASTGNKIFTSNGLAITIVTLGSIEVEWSVVQNGWYVISSQL